MSLSKNNIKIITSLAQKKYRNKLQLFVAEGVKVVKELLASSFELETLYVTESQKELFSDYDHSLVSEADLKKVSSLKTPSGVFALFKIPAAKSLSKGGLVVALDGINDPGNLGTIIRLCDWFGVEQLICSLDTVDCYNSKVVQSTMGSLSRLQINYTDLDTYLKTVESQVFITDMNGENVYSEKLPASGVLVMGNEANGVSKNIKEISSTILTIPRFGTNQVTESLNVATATAILLSEFRRT